VLQKEYADQYGGQTRIQTAALPMQPWFAARQEPPSLHFQPKHFFYGPDKSRQTVTSQRPRTARARMQQDGSLSRVQQDDDTQTGSANNVTPFKAAEQICARLFQESPQPRRPTSARTPRLNLQHTSVNGNSDHQDALGKHSIHRGDGMDGAVLRPGGAQTPLLHVSQYKGQQTREGLQGSLVKGSRRQSALSARPPSTPRHNGGDRQQRTGGMLGSSPAPGGWTTKRDPKDPGFMSTIVSARLEHRPTSACKASTLKTSRIHPE